MHQLTIRIWKQSGPFTFTEERAVVTELSGMKRATVTSVKNLEKKSEFWEVIGFLDAGATDNYVFTAMCRS